MMSAFNLPGNHNPMLRAFAIEFAKRRTGLVRCEDSNDFTCMIKVIMDAFMAYTPPKKGEEDMEIEDDATPSKTDKPAGKTAGKGQAWLIAVHMANDHLCLNGVTPVIIHPDKAENNLLDADRANTTKDLWSNGQRYRVEARPDVTIELEKFLEDNGIDIVGQMPMFDDQPPPQAPPPPADEDELTDIF